MPIFSIFNSKNHFIRRINCEEIDLTLNLQAGERYLLGDWSNHYLVDSQPVEKPPRPSDYHNWDVEAKAWVADLESAKSAMWDKIQIERTRRMEGGYPVAFGGKTWWMHSDSASLGQQQGLVQMAQLTAMRGKDMNAEITKWKTMSGEFVGITGNFALAMFAAGMAQQGAIFQRAEIHKAKMFALAEPWAYDFSGGWSKIYGEV